MHPGGATIPNKFRVGWELIVTALTVLQLEASEVPELMISVEDRGKEGIKSLRFICAPVCEATILIKEQTHVISGLPFAVNVF